MNRTNFFISLALAMFAMVGNAAASQADLQADGNLPALRVEGKNLVDANGKTVVLHGVMDTPNRYFNGWRWQQWKADYSEADIQPCLEYFSKQFAAITDKEQGAYCTVFRLHMDPCWTNDPSKKAENEADISAFNMARYRLYLQKLYIPLIKDAIAHGLYVIVRPPGVCPGDISVGDKYNRYLKSIWKAFAADEYIRQNSGVISIELANEPVRVHLSDGSNSDKALHDFFQPVVDEIRAQGFKGIIWVPGAGYQSQYENYAKYPITDSEANFSYAVHVYSGWYGNMTDKKELRDEESILQGIIRFGDETAREIMTSRQDIVDLDINAPYSEVLACVVENQYSRIPVYQGNEDNMRGILYIKDLLPHISKPATFRWQSLLRPPYFVPETKKIDDLLKDFQENKVHIAIVVDEFGGTSGIVTMEDILEEIVGEINDEFDDEKRQYTKLNYNTYVIEGKTLLTDLVKILSVDEDEFDEVSKDADTVAGMILEIKGDFPSLHERIEYKNYIFEILEIDGRRISKVKTTVNSK